MVEKLSNKKGKRQKEIKKISKKDKDNIFNFFLINKLFFIFLFKKE